MALIPGTRLGPYEITAQIGLGGMGEVYRATDTNLKRSVAIKVLPTSVVGDAERLARFQREAEVLAALNHPNIAQIHGLEKSDGTVALVMELVEGDDLSQRIARGAIPIDEALPIAHQIAEALEAAHEQGIIHRDLKPANIMVRPDGTVKVLDFGLAKAMEPVGAMAVSNSMSPTITTPAMTQAGMILGTAAYMSPEQARGKTVDKRADIWAFGALLYEMLTGGRAFAGDDVSDVLASVLAREPEWARLPANVSPVLGTYLRRCLHKDPKQRIPDIAAMRLALEGAFENTQQPNEVAAMSVATQPMGWRRALSLGLALVAGAAVAGLAVWGVTRPRPRLPTRFVVSASSTSSVPFANPVAISPDGRTLVFSTGGDGLYRRDMAQLDPQRISGTEGAVEAFFSPDGQWVAFTGAGGRSLRKVSLGAGLSVPIAEAAATVRGASWGADDNIVFGALDAGLSRVSAAGGQPEPITTLKEGEANHHDPDILPGGKAVVFAITGETPKIAVASLETGEHRTLLTGARPRYAATGHIVFTRGFSVWAVPFDASRLEVTGAAVPILEGVSVGAGSAQFDLSDEGALVYVPRGAEVIGRNLVWVDREGREELLGAPARPYNYPRISPDGARVAFTVAAEENDIWIWDFARKTQMRFTFDPGVDSYPAWTPDGGRVAFESRLEGNPSKVFWKPADGTGTVERLAEGQGNLRPYAFSPDGQWLVVGDTGPEGFQLKRASLSGDHSLEPLIGSPFHEGNAELSPDGRWLAYESNASGEMDVYVRPFPDVEAGQWMVSIEGGTRPLWSRDGHELFYLDDGRLMAVPVETDPAFIPGSPEVVFKETYYAPTAGAIGRSYDVSPDGQRFLMIKEGGDASTATNIVVVQDFLQELIERAPVP